MTGLNNKVLGVIRNFLDLSDQEQAQAMEVLSEYYIADASARDIFVSAVREFASDLTDRRSDPPQADVKVRHHKMY
jgi:hypothetical protein